MSQIVATPVQRQAMTALTAFLSAILPQGQAIFTGAISGSTLTISGVTSGAVAAGMAIVGERVLAGTYIVSLGTGTGGTGTYTLNQSQTVSSSLMYTGVPVVQAQVNRVPEVKQGDFVLMTPIMRTRLSTNVDTYSDVTFTGSIAGTTLTVTQTGLGTIQPSQTLYAAGVTVGTRILANLTGTGGLGTYLVTPSQTVTSQLIAAGGANLMQPTELSVQLDVHGPNGADNAQTITTVFRDWSGVDIFSQTGFDVTPLTVSDPRQIPFINESQQYENRWVVDVSMQINPILTLPQQFADQLDLTVNSVEEEFPV